MEVGRCGRPAALLDYYINNMPLKGRALEIGGHRLELCSKKHFPEDRFEYFDLNIKASDIPNTIISDITNASNIPDNSFDIIFSSDVFEHIDRPWLAASEICRILKPGGIAITVTLWSWRNHPCPIDYWRFSPECLAFLFSGIETLEKGYDLSLRRWNQPGFWGSKKDSVPVDELGGWREHWAVYHVGGKDVPPDCRPKKFKETDHELAKFLRMDTQGLD
jgi:SAM-dependent methyltransferase